MCVWVDYRIHRILERRCRVETPALLRMLCRAVTTENDDDDEDEDENDDGHYEDGDDDAAAADDDDDDDEGDDEADDDTTIIIVIIVLVMVNGMSPSSFWSWPSSCSAFRSSLYCPPHDCAMHPHDYCHFSLNHGYCRQAQGVAARKEEGTGCRF